MKKETKQSDSGRKDHSETYIYKKPTGIRHFFQKIVGIASYPRTFRIICLKYAVLYSLVSITIMLSFAWISLWYLKFLSFTEFGIVMALGNVTGILLDYPLGLVTDKTGVKKSYMGSMIFLAIYYVGMTVTQTFFGFFVLHLIVGFYSALISGTINTWLMNTWEVHAKEHIEAKKKINSDPFFWGRNMFDVSSIEFNNLFVDFNSFQDEYSGDPPKFGGAWSNVSFLTGMATSAIMGLGGFSILLFGSQNVSDIFAILTFITQAGISLIGCLMAWIWMTEAKNSLDQEKNKAQNTEDSLKSNGRITNLLGPNFVILVIIFAGFSFQASTLISFDEFVVAPILFQVFFLTAFYISNFRSGRRFTNAFANRLSTKFTSKFVKHPMRAYIKTSIFTWCISWFFFTIISYIHTPVFLGLVLFLGMYYLRGIVGGLMSANGNQLYYTITESKRRSSQESLYNTLYMLIGGASFLITGRLLDTVGFSGTFLFFFACSCMGVIISITFYSKHYYKMKFGSQTLSEFINRIDKIAMEPNIQNLLNIQNRFDSNNWINAQEKMDYLSKVLEKMEKPKEIKKPGLTASPQAFRVSGKLAATELID